MNATYEVTDSTRRHTVLEAAQKAGHIDYQSWAWGEWAEARHSQEEEARGEAQILRLGGGGDDGGDAHQGKPVGHRAADTLRDRSQIPS